MRIEGDFPVAAPLEAVWSALLDPNIVGPCIPGCGAIEVLSDREYRATVKVELGPIKVSFNAVVTVTDIVEHEVVHSTTKGEEGSRASILSSANTLRVERIGADATQVHYASDVSVTGRLGKFGLGIMKKKAAELGRVFGANLSARLSAPADDLAIPEQAS